MTRSTGDHSERRISAAEAQQALTEYYSGKTFYAEHPLNPVFAFVAQQVEQESNWKPTAENINALPAGLRKYIHDLASKCDPAGDVRTIGELRDTVAALEQLEQERREKVLSESYAAVGIEQVDGEGRNYVPFDFRVFKSRESADEYVKAFGAAWRLTPDGVLRMLRIARVRVVELTEEGET